MTDHLIPHRGPRCTANGRVAMCADGADILQLFGPVYSMPSLLSMRLAEDLTVTCERLSGTPVYVTTLRDAAESAVESAAGPVGQMIDYAHPSEPVFIRRLSLSRPVTFFLSEAFSAVDTSPMYEGRARARLYEIPDGTVVFSKSRTDKEVFCQLLLPPDCTVEGNKITFPSGDTCLIFVAGDCGENGFSSFPNCMVLSDAMLSADLDALREAYIASWRDLLKDLPALPDEAGGRALVERVALALLTQTSREGGVLAGLPYHLAYGRDMYGVIRGYLALRMFDRARGCIDYFARMWRARGYMPNASGMGMGCSHHHENDGSEQTGYYLLELTDYAQATEDPAILRAHLDYGVYLLEAQERLLSGGMMPFNGDETYIAGGLFPRGGIDHGSMEATALYIGSALRFLDMCEREGLLDPSYVAAHRQTAIHAKEAFVRNFTEGEKVFINQPSRATEETCPPYRHGVCHSCSRMTWLRRTPELGYLCASCYGRASAASLRERLSLDCALWMPVFAGCSLLPDAILKPALRSAVEAAYACDFGRASDRRAVGYEYGVLLYAMSSLDMTDGGDGVLSALLSHGQSGGVWAEYDLRGLPDPTSTPYRPWESAINLVSIMTYVQAVKKRRIDS